MKRQIRLYFCTHEITISCDAMYHFIVDVKHPIKSKSFSTTKPRTRDNPHYSWHCTHCGNGGHSSDSCPRSNYQAKAPAFLCTKYTHLVESDFDTPYNIIHRIITCDQYSTTATSTSTTLSGPSTSSHNQSSRSLQETGFKGGQGRVHSKRLCG